MLRVAVLFDTFGPYHCARLNAAQGRMEILGMELCGGSAIYEWNRIIDSTTFRRVTLFPERKSNQLDVSELETAFLPVLWEFKPDVVAIPGWAFKSSLVLLEVCLKLGLPAIVMSESTAWDSPRQWYRELLKRQVVSLFSSGFVGGQPHRDYLSALGMPEKSIFNGYDVVDNDYFARMAKAAREKEFHLRNEYLLPDRYFLASARFVGKKNLSRLIEAYALYRNGVLKKPSDSVSNPLPWDLVILGNGPLKAELCQQIETLGLKNKVHLPGFIQYEKLHVYYGLAGAFVHASTTEQWGLVVNEAIASGLPVLVSNRCGCASELVQENRNGFTFDPFNTSQLAERMTAISAPAFARSDLSLIDEQIISHWTTQIFGEQLQAASLHALSRRVKSGKYLARGVCRLIRNRSMESIE